jgi:NAD-dependent deacetylase
MIDKIISDIPKPIKIVAVVGSGLSAGSGMPTFRGKDGRWKNYNAQDLATRRAFSRDPNLVWNWYRWRMRKLLAAKPNAGHYSLVELEKKGLLVGIITQNVDGLHEISGNRTEYLVEIQVFPIPTHIHPNFIDRRIISFI